jgi:Immunoglobulin I-set domain
VWLKDGDSILPSLGANVSSLDQYTSILSIPSLSHSHSGEYTCVASNQASEVKYSASLQVKGNAIAATILFSLAMLSNVLMLPTIPPLSKAKSQITEIF